MARVENLASLRSVRASWDGPLKFEEGRLHGVNTGFSGTNVGQLRPSETQQSKAVRRFSFPLNNVKRIYEEWDLLVKGKIEQFETTDPKNN